MKRDQQGAQDLKPAPGRLSLVQTFLNTADREVGRDELASPRALADWLARHGLLPPGTELDEADRRRVVAVREAWRTMLGGSPTPKAIETLNAATETALLRPRYDADGLIRLEPVAGGVDGVLGRLLAIALRAQIDGRWQRLKACASPTCQAAFYDRSNNQSARWCRPRCGNRFSSKASKRRSRRSQRKDREAQRRAWRQGQQPPARPTPTAMETHPELEGQKRAARDPADGE